MAIGAGSLLEFKLQGALFGQVTLNMFTYRVVGELGDVTPPQWGNAWWNAIKTTLRPLVASVHGAAFITVSVREMDDPAGEYGVFSIPVGETAGTGATGAGGVLPPFNAAGIRFLVATRITRPGQKRISGQDESYMNGSGWETSYATALNNFAAIAAAPMTFGAPALGSQVQPIVVKKDPATGLPVAHQDVTGYLVNGTVTSQVSRKIGRGA